jgi:hypothetical protein
MYEVVDDKDFTVTMASAGRPLTVAVTTLNNVSELSLYSRSVLSKTLLSTVVD